MRASVQLLGVALACAFLTLPGCRSKNRPNFEAVLSIPPGESSASESSLAEELRVRADSLGLTIKVDPGESDGRLTVKLRAKDKDQALAHLDTLCESGSLSVRAVHPRNAYLLDIAGKDPSQLPPNHEILTFNTELDDLSRQEKLVVENVEIVSDEHVESAEAEAGKKPSVHISLTVKGGQRMIAATEKMQKSRSRLAIIYDERIISAPVVAHGLGAQFTLENFTTFEEAQAVAASLNKPLSTELLIESLMPLAR